ncbi:uncharacterized protein [Cicer arietinum]|uniref:Uncharacterized protein LOC101505081 isoform X2 n=1 Tax=Cicer arietinum TaxID=3827 RepID=A0A1S2XP40_CICAR|nr:uncharacterized protein LOC101505081 isoform X2 [Cicer arietinum]
MENHVVEGNPSHVPRTFIDSTWKDANYKRRAIASLIQAVYLLELDRQENRTKENSLAPDFWIPFKYKPTQTLIDERDGSIFGAIFEFDRFASLSELKPFKPIGAPRAVLALRGTLIRLPTMRRDFEDDLRFAAWESLKDSVRFKVAIDAVKSVSDKYGSRNVCIAGHSLGAGFGLQVGKELAKERINVETHLFNPPSVSLAMSLGNIGEKAEYVWNRVKSMLYSASEAHVNNDVDENYIIRLKRMIPRLSRLMDAGFGTGKWVPHLYVNSKDWISYFYIHTDGAREKITEVENINPTNEQNEAKLFVVSKEDQKFLEAHGLKQWWSSDGSNLELKHNICNSKLVSMQLKSLNAGTPSQVILFYYPQYVSLAASRINIREATYYAWNMLKCLPHLRGKTQINNDGEETSGIGLLNWIPQLSGLKDTGYWVCKWVPRLYGAEEKVVRKENMDPEDERIGSKVFIVSKEQLKFLAAHGLEQRWPNDAELQKTIRDGKLISRHMKYLYTSTPWEVTKGSNRSFLSLPICLKNIGEKEEFVWKWDSIKSILLSSSENQVKNNDFNKTSGVALKSWMMPPLSGFMDAGFAAVKWIPHMYSNNSDYISKRLRSLNFVTPSEVSHMFNLPYVSPAMMSLGNAGEKAKYFLNRLVSTYPSSNEAQVSNDSDKTSYVGMKGWIPSLSGLKDAAFGVGKLVPYLYAKKSGGKGEKMVEKENKGTLK